jgi:hypothetical protein
MTELKTVVLIKGEERVIVNAGDQEHEYMSEGWLHEGDEGIVEGTKHVGGGWYELPNGTRIQGKAAAEEALAALNVSK